MTEQNRFIERMPSEPEIGNLSAVVRSKNTGRTYFAGLTCGEDGLPRLADNEIFLSQFSLEDFRMNPGSVEVDFHRLIPFKFIKAPQPIDYWGNPDIADESVFSYCLVDEKGEISIFESDERGIVEALDLKEQMTLPTFFVSAKRGSGDVAVVMFDDPESSIEDIKLFMQQSIRKLIVGEELTRGTSHYMKALLKGIEDLSAREKLRVAYKIITNSDEHLEIEGEELAMRLKRVTGMLERHDFKMSDIESIMESPKDFSGLDITMLYSIARSMREAYKDKFAGND